MKEDFSHFSMLDLFRIEAENQTQALIAGLLALERDPNAAEHLEACMRAAHSLKGAARVVDLAFGIDLAHAMEDLFVAAQHGDISLRQHQIDLLLRGADLLLEIAKAPEDSQKTAKVTAFLTALKFAFGPNPEQGRAEENAEPDLTLELEQVAQPPIEGEHNASNRVLRVTADHLNRLLGLAGESLMISRQLRPLIHSLLSLKRMQDDAGKAVDALREALPPAAGLAEVQAAEARSKLLECQELLSQERLDLETLDLRFASIAQHLYDEALACRMLPFADGVQHFPRLVRDLSRSLGKRARLEIVGLATQVDRDILERLDAPLGHLLHNAVDHGIESPEERVTAGKSPEGVIQLEARHSAGMLQITISDDGRGIDIDQLREAVVARRLSTPETVSKLSKSELLEFLFLSGFTMKSVVTEVSGRGVGLDVVQNMIKQVRGVVYASTQPGLGTRFQMHLPLTLSVLRTLLVEIGGEPYAFPLAHIVSTVKLQKAQVEFLEGRQHFNFHGRQIGLVMAHQILEGRNEFIDSSELSIVVVGDQQEMYGLVVDRLLGQQELVVRPFDTRLGKIKDISAAALTEDGAPVLILDVEDMIRSVEKLVSSGPLSKIQPHAGGAAPKPRKRILVVDDSLTVRELQRKLLDRSGYEVEVAVDGMDGWNLARTGNFDLVITDIDMPRMDGIELVKSLRQHASLKSRPVMIVSYKDREEDRQRGLEAGADYYLTKGSFHDDSLVQAVIDLIGEADA
jgi:two-component system, chemotaxis family, sensor histidine kinase and response regulator WspE